MPMSSRGVLVLTNSKDETADYLCNYLEQQGRAFVRLNTDSVLPALSVSYSREGPKLKVKGHTLAPKDVQSIWYRRPKELSVPGISDKGEETFVKREWSEAIEGFLAHVSPKRWINHPADNTFASHKMEQLTRAAEHSLKIPDTTVTQDPDELRAFWRKAKGSVIAKPLRVGAVERSNASEDTVIYTSPVEEGHLNKSEVIARCPTLFQERIEKRVDVRITVVDEDVTAAALKARGDAKDRVDIRRDNMAEVEYSTILVPAEVREKLLKLLRSYGLRFAAVDFVVSSEGEWVFLEINPNGQWAWLDLEGVTEIAGAFERAFYGTPS